MDVLTALRSVEEEMNSRRMKKFLKEVIFKVENGSVLWRSLQEINIFPPRIISLIRIGEESGRLVENITTVVQQLEKEWLFKSKIRTAMLYPAIVLPMTLFVGIGAGWFTLPKLAAVFTQLDADLPYLTRVLIKVGEYLSEYGNVVVPLVLFSFIIVLYFLFSFPRTKALGQILISKMPIFKRLILEVELARIGYILSSLLKSGIPINYALDSLHDSTTFYIYKKFYKYLSESIEVGQSLRDSFKNYKKINKLIPLVSASIIIRSCRSLKCHIIGSGKGISPSPSHGTVRESLPSYGSSC
jgi:type II secretory pathway component PulF